MNLSSMTLHEASDKLRKRELSSQELTEAVFQRVAQTDGILRSYITLCRDTAIAQAKEADKRLKHGPSASPLLGIPIALKDNLLTQGLRTTCASRILENFIPPYDATAVAKVRSAGAVITGKTNLDEFAMGSSAENSAFFSTRNPWHVERVPGGSSGGSAASVAADQCIAAIGTDTGGSIRQPAAFCGIVGMKPTYGRVSRYGVIAFASSMDQVGPMTKDVRDCALLLETISGHDPADSTSVNLSVPSYSQSLTGEIAGLHLGIPKEYFTGGLQSAVDEAVMNATRQLEKRGAIIEEISLPHTEYAVAVYYIIATAEASSNLARYDGMRYGQRAVGSDLTETYMRSRAQGLGPEVKRRIMLGTYALSVGYYDAYYLKAQKVRALIHRDFDAAFKHCDAIITPTSPTTAFKISEKIQNPLEMYLSDICTISINLAGVPAISVPCGLDGEGLPIGMQVIGKPFDEATILGIAYAYEQQTEWHRKKTCLICGMKYETIIGLEVHAQLLTDSKIFCGCSTRYGAAPNHNTCPVCAGFPGALPVLNKKVVEFAVRAGLAMNCKIAVSSRLARKNYFYPDLPKGYQISQYERPICTNGYIDISVGGSTKRVRLTRIHIEEDAGKNIHNAYGDSSLIDLNRSGVPLLEIVSEPDISDAAEGVTYLKSLRAILRYLEICDGNMEEGSFRCDANISVRTIGTESLGTKVEIKNLNSFKAIEKALQYETERQIDTLSGGGTLVQETRLWDENNEQTRSMRSKESAQDYRYFPDPDLLPINLDEAWIQKVRNNLPELPDARKVRFMSQYGLPPYDAELLTSRRDVADYFEVAITICPNAKALSNWIMGDLFRLLKARKLDEQLRIDNWPLQPTQLGELVQLIDQGKISGKIAKMIFDALLDTSESPQHIITARGLEQVSDPASLERSIDQVLTNHAQQVAAYRDGNEKIFGFLVGQVMKASQGKANPQTVNELLKAKLS